MPFLCSDDEMDEGCEKRLVSLRTRNASAVMARRTASNMEKKEAYEQLLGIRWSKPLMKEVSPHVLSGLIRRGLSGPATSQMATVLRKGLCQIWTSIGGDVDVDSGSWRSFVEKHGREDELSKQGWDEAITQMQGWLISNPDDLAKTRWDFVEEAIKGAQHCQ